MEKDLIATIVINSPQKVFLFQEKLFNGIITNSYICLKNYKIIRSRDEKYWNARINNKKWV